MLRDLSKSMRVTGSRFLYGGEKTGCQRQPVMTDTYKPKIEELPEEVASWKSYRETCRSKQIDTVKLYVDLAEEEKCKLTSPGAHEDFVELCEAKCFQPALAGIVILLRYAPRFANPKI